MSFNFRTKLMSLIEDAVISGMSTDEVERQVRDVALGESKARYVPAPVSPELIAAHENLLAADVAFDAQWTKHLRDVRPLDDGRFWELVPELKKEIESFLWKLKRSNGVEQACEEFFRKAVCRQCDYSFDEALGFYVAYDQMVERVRTNLESEDVDLSDDGLNDFLDSAPLLELKSIKDDEVLVYENLKLARQRAEWKKFVFEGENYVRMHLHDAAKTYMRTALNIKKERS